MSRYQIWNHTDNIITPSGEMFTPEQWMERYAWANVPGVKMVITAPPINGGVAEVFSDMVTRYTKLGCPITDEMTDEEVLAAIEYFEDHPPQASEATANERIAAALEAQVMMAEPDSEIATVSTFSLDAEPDAELTVSPAFQRILSNYSKGLWSQSLVALAVQKGHITLDEAQGIIALTTNTQQ